MRASIDGTPPITLLVLCIWVNYYKVPMRSNNQHTYVMLLLRALAYIVIIY